MANWEKKNFVIAVVSAITACITTLIAVFLFFQVSEAAKDFEGLQISAKISPVAKTIVFVPKSHNGLPLQIFGTGYAVDPARPNEDLQFRVILSVLTKSEQNPNGYTLSLEDLRPVVCQNLRPGKTCDNLEIEHLGIEVIFNRGPKAAIIYENLPISLNS